MKSRDMKGKYYWIHLQITILVNNLGFKGLNFDQNLASIPAGVF